MTSDPSDLLSFFFINLSTRRRKPQMDLVLLKVSATVARSGGSNYMKPAVKFVDFALQQMLRSCVSIYNK